MRTRRAVPHRWFIPGVIATSSSRARRLPIICGIPGGTAGRARPRDGASSGSVRTGVSMLRDNGAAGHCEEMPSGADWTRAHHSRPIHQGRLATSRAEPVTRVSGPSEVNANARSVAADRAFVFLGDVCAAIGRTQCLRSRPRVLRSRGNGELRRTCGSPWQRVRPPACRASRSFPDRSIR